MQIDYALILAAGLGTRMGDIGKILPKPLWPIFNKSLLELQIQFCYSLGIKKIYINSYFLSDKIQAFVKGKKEYSDIKVLVEDPLLDSGGAIHNLASRGEVLYSGNLLLVNADQFMFFDKKYYVDGLNALEDSRASLFGIKVAKHSKYNEVVTESNRLVNIVKPSGKVDFVTYSGLGVLKLDGLEPVAGISKFFETVANYKNEKINIITPNKFEYWDFGTSSVYLESIKNIYQNSQIGKESQLINFLNENGVDTLESKTFFSLDLNSIDLQFQGRFFKNRLIYDSIKQEVAID